MMIMMLVILMMMIMMMMTSYREQIKSLTVKLKQAEARAEFAEKSVQKLQNEV